MSSIGHAGLAEVADGDFWITSLRINVYPYDDPWNKDGDYDKKKRFSSAKLKKSSECVIKKARIVCE